MKPLPIWAENREAGQELAAETDRTGPSFLKKTGLSEASYNQQLDLDKNCPEVSYFLYQDLAIKCE